LTFFRDGLLEDFLIDLAAGQSAGACGADQCPVAPDGDSPGLGV
jgi:hypothetical protein